MKGYILLEDGTTLVGRAFGSKETLMGEIFFHTEMAGYEDIFTDSANAGTVVLMTYPLLGNYGFAKEDLDGKGAEHFPTAIVVKDYAEVPSHFKGTISFPDFLEKNNIFGLAFVDTRVLTRKIRDYGSQKCMLTVKEPDENDLNTLKAFVPSTDIKGSQKGNTVYEKEGSDGKIGLLDLGSCSILPQLSRLKTVCRFHKDMPVQEILDANLDGLVISHGGGVADDALVQKVKKIAESGVPVRGVGFGAYVLAKAFGADCAKMNNGHRGSNYPVLVKSTNKVLITTQNHLYDIKTLPTHNGAQAQVTHTNVNDNTTEGFVLKTKDVNIAGLMFALPEDALTKAINPTLLELVADITERSGTNA